MFIWASVSDSFRDLLVAEFRPYADLSSTQLRQLEEHYNLLIRWNERLNLTRITGLLDSVRFHYCESLYLGLKLPVGPLRVADVGTGAGFPGIPIAILRPDLHITLIESHQRKSVFLREAIRNFANARVLSARAEDVSEKYDWVISRAVSAKEVLSAGLAPHYGILLAGADAPAASKRARSPWGIDRLIASST